jgi:hypothetical protein
MAGMTSRSPEMMDELFRLCYLLESNNIHIKLWYIISAANTWANKLSCHLDSDD